MKMELNKKLGSVLEKIVKEYDYQGEISFHSECIYENLQDGSKQAVGYTHHTILNVDI